MSRWWNEFVAGPIDAFGLALVLLALLFVAGLIGVAWQWYPAWIPRSNPFRGLFTRRPGRGRLRNKLGWGGWRRKRKASDSTAAEPTVVESTDELPNLPVEAFRSNADRLAAEGRYAEAVRERLRAIVRVLVDAGVIVGHPGWTVSELARAAAAARGALRQPLDGASLVFSDIWYGERAAYASHDAKMRTYAEQVDTIVETTPVGAGR